MMSSMQREALAVLTEVWELCPEVRLGQLFAHLGFLGEDQVDQSLGYIDDDQMLAVLYRHRGELLARLTDAGESPTVHAEIAVPESPSLPQSTPTAER